jgi:DNA-binding transcriptional ArsR family regulator
MALVDASWTQSNVDVDRMGEHAREASEFLKALAHEGRLMILCDLLRGEKSVGELEALLSRRQSTVSQQLARLRLEGLVSTRRDGQTVYYSIASDRARSKTSARSMPRSALRTARSGPKDEARFVTINHACRECYLSAHFFRPKDSKPNQIKPSKIAWICLV